MTWRRYFMPPAWTLMTTIIVFKNICLLVSTGRDRVSRPVPIRAGEGWTPRLISPWLWGAGAPSVSALPPGSASRSHQGSLNRIPRPEPNLIYPTWLIFLKPPWLPQMSWGSPGPRDLTLPGKQRGRAANNGLLSPGRNPTRGSESTMATFLWGCGPASST